VNRRDIPTVKTYGEQLSRWIRGRSVHVFKSHASGIECCPDFSCCRPRLRVPVPVRKRFARASRKVRDGMLIGFLAAMLRDCGHEVSSPRPEGA